MVKILHHKKAISRRLLGTWMTVIMLLTAGNVAAQTFLKDGLYYKVNTLNPNEVAITGVGVAFITHALDISTINNNNVTYSLTTIGKNALLRNHYVESVTFPKVTSIEEGAFNGCDYLTSENIPNVTSIPKNAFSNCVKLTGADFPNATSIGELAFSKCGKLTSLNFPIATGVGIDAFNSCVSLKSVTFPKAETIKMRAFYLCHSLTSLDFPITESIGEDAFNTCDSLRSVDFQKAKTIGNAAFRGCKKLTSLNFPIANTIEDYAFAECSSLSSVDFPNAETIGNEAFMFCTTLVSATFPKVTFIGSFVFSNCNKFSSLRLGATPPSVDTEPFSYCPTSRNITIVDANGIPLAGAALKAAVNAYKADAGYDTATKLWYGWTLPKIADSDLADANIYFSDTSYEADGSQQKPGVTVVLEGKTLAEGTDYTVSYGENVNPGKGTVTITGAGE